MFWLIISLGYLTGLVCANLVSWDLVQHEARKTIPNGFVRSAAAAANQVLTLRIALAQHDMAGLEKALYDISTPGSPLYGQHLSKEEVENLVAPKPETVSAVNNWLASNNITSKPISSAGDWIELTVLVSKANAMLGADFNVFLHEPTGMELIRTLAYSIPKNLKDHIDLIHPTIAFDIISSSSSFATVTKPLVSANSVTDAAPASCTATQITPACLQALYGIPAQKATHTSNTIGVSGFFQQFANQADLSTFLTNFRSDLTGATFSLQTVDGGTNPQQPSSAGIEANLNIQYTVGVASGVSTSFISVGNQTMDGANGFLDIIVFLIKQPSPPRVLSTSYGFNEQDLSSALANSLCNAYMILGALGTSVIFNSGDGGVAGFQQQTCTSFIPTFPSGCPFVTSVGGTVGIPEVSLTSTSGGFSNVFGRPSYQNVAVPSYFKFLGNRNSGLFSANGRAYPDVAAQGQNLQAFVSGRKVSVTGTSGAAPIFASIISLLNDQLIAAGKPVLGFLNPFLYSNGSSTFTDITNGQNPGCGTAGFPAIGGWDPVTGLGTPNFLKLKAAVGL